MPHGQVAAGGYLVGAAQDLSAVLFDEAQGLVEGVDDGGGVGAAVRGERFLRTREQQVTADAREVQVAVGEPESRLLSGELDEGRQCHVQVVDVDTGKGGEHRHGHLLDHFVFPETSNRSAYYGSRTGEDEEGPWDSPTKGIRTWIWLWCSMP